jgi:ribosomal protein S18 acetylase RimI-like enzyme
MISALSSKNKSQLEFFVESNFKEKTHSSWGAEDLMRELGQGLQYAYFAEDKIEAVIFAREQPEAIEVMFIGTASDRRRRGLAKALLLHILNTCSQPQRLWLEVHEKNTEALALYDRLGFAQVGLRKNYYPDGGSAHLMEYKHLH